MKRVLATTLLTTDMRVRAEAFSVCPVTVCNIRRYTQKTSQYTNTSGKSFTQKGRKPLRGMVEAATAAADEKAMGWSYEEVNPATGKTSLDVLYEANLDRIRAILEQPLPRLPPDGTIEPDFFVGFAHYNYRLRDEYRALIARELHVPVQAVRLSVAWSGRFDVSRFSRVQKVCGVHIERSFFRDEHPRRHSNTRSGQGDDAQVERGDEDGSSAREREAQSATGATEKEPLPSHLQARVDALVAAIVARRTEHLLSAQMLQAAGAVPEVEFALTQQEQRLLARLHAWMKEHILQANLVVLLYGGNTSDRDYQKLKVRQQLQQSGTTSKKYNVAAGTDAMNTNLNSSSEGTPWYAGDAVEAARQREYIEKRWLKSFHSREVIPRILSLGTLASQLGHAVVSGEVASAGNSSEGSALVEAELLQFLSHKCGKDGTAAGKECALPVDGIFTDATALASLSTEKLALAQRWLYLTRHALFFGSRGIGGESGSGSGGVRESKQLPAIFVHGAYAGGPQEMRYLQHNKRAMDALLLHPNDITLKKSFASRLRNGHSRLRMHEEAVAGAHGGGS